jgi:hypothetical protein
MHTDWWLPLLVPVRVYISRLRLRHVPDPHVQKITTIFQMLMKYLPSQAHEACRVVQRKPREARLAQRVRKLAPRIGYDTFPDVPYPLIDI